MNEDGQNAAEKGNQEQPAGTPEGAVGAEPTAEEIAELYKATGVKAPVPTGKTKGRPKSSDVRAEDDKKNGAGSSDSGKKEENADDKSKSQDASDSDKGGDKGNKVDPKASKDGDSDGKVPEKSKEADSGVRNAESKGEEDSERGGEKGTGDGTKPAGQEAHAEGDQEEEGQDVEGKRPGKSNPEVEKRFQKLTNDLKESNKVIQDLQAKLQEKDRAVEQVKIAQEDPEYTIEDFRKVQDSEGNIIDLDKNQAELAWRRWKDGYDQRASERAAKDEAETARIKEESEMQQRVMEESVKAYDSLSSLMEEYPELVSTSDKYDPDFAAKAMPVVQNAIEYLEGTEPGNAEKNLPVVIGLKIDPRLLLDALKGIHTEKRDLPLNGVNDNVESRSNVSVPHSRSSDPTVQAANELMKELNIDKRF